MNISGAGSLPGGVYDDSIHISGSGKITGTVSCTSFHSSGSGKVDGDIFCSEALHSSGSCRIEGSVQAESVSSSGSFHSGGTVSSPGTVRASGSFHSKSVNVAEFHTSGSANVEGDISAEEVKISGGIKCSGLLNAENIHIRFGGNSGAGNIGGSSIKIVRGDSFNIGGFFSRIFGGKDTGRFDVPGSIEGDEIYLEYVGAASVTGRVVKIGPGCDIGQVSYIESVEISDEASVGSTEQLNG